MRGGDQRVGHAGGGAGERSWPPRQHEAPGDAQTPAEAAAWPAELALAESFDPAFYGELVQFGNVLPWESGIPVAHTATT
jgi:hypothetical protein